MYSIKLLCVIDPQENDQHRDFIIVYSKIRKNGSNFIYPLNLRTKWRVDSFWIL